jgi:LysW-gamma-L-lysine carboxypeptidase
MERKGFQTTMEDHGLVINPDGKRFLFLGHIDTVPGEIPVRVEDRILHGRGSVDAKGPLCAAACAMAARKEISEDICLVAVLDEEGDSGCAWDLIEKRDPTPAVILEPSDTRGITIQYNGRMVMDLEFASRLSHAGSGIPYATEKAVKYYSEMGEGARILSMVGDREGASMTVDWRFDEIPEVAPPDGGNIEVREMIPPYRADKRSWLVRTFLRSIRGAGMKPVFKRKTGTCDMNILGANWDVPLVAYGPGDGRLDHTPDERILLNDFLGSVDVLKSVIDDVSNRRQNLSGGRANS